MAKLNTNGDTIDRSKDRIKQTGEVFTPRPLIDEMLDKLPATLFTNPEKTFLDPAAGNGNFIVAVIERKIAKQTESKTVTASIVRSAIHTTYAVEIMEDNIDLIKQRVRELVKQYGVVIRDLDKLLEHNVIHTNSLEYPYDELQPYGPGKYQSKTRPAGVGALRADGTPIEPPQPTPTKRAKSTPTKQEEFFSKVFPDSSTAA